MTDPITTAPSPTALTRPIRVMHSLPAPDGTTQWVDHMLGAGGDGLEMTTFDWRRAMFGRYDVLHVHWPELLVRGDGRLYRAAKRLAVRALLLRLRLAGIPLVRTLHNLEPHEPGSAGERRMLRRFDRSTAVFVRLNPTTPLPDGVSAPVELVPHGHYRDRFADLPVATAVPGRVLFVGIIRPYKGVERLIELVHDSHDDALRLRIVGSPAPGMAELVERAAADDPRISARLERVDDAALVAEVTAAEVVVLPYRQLHNSGIALVALSLGRPVLVPDNPTTAALAAEVGEAWVSRFVGEPTAADVTAARAAAAAATAPPRLDGRDWADVARGLRRAYTRALGREDAS